RGGLAWKDDFLFVRKTPVRQEALKMHAQPLPSLHRCSGINEISNHLNRRNQLDQRIAHILGWSSQAYFPTVDVNREPISSFPNPAIDRSLGDSAQKRII